MCNWLRELSPSGFDTVDWLKEACVNTVPVILKGSFSEKTGEQNE